MSDATWAAIRCRATDPDHSGLESEEHPQFTMKCLLDALGVARGEVAVWDHGGGRDGPPERARIVAEAMAPAAVTGEWRAATVDRAPLADVRTVVAANPAEEAQVVALALRRALDHRVRRRRSSRPTGPSPAASRRIAAAGGLRSTIRRGRRSR